MRRKGYFFLLMIFFPMTSVAGETDSIFYSLDTLKGKEKLETLNSITRSYVMKSLEKCKEYGQLQIKLASELEFAEYRAHAHSHMGYANFMVGNYQQSIKHYNTASVIYDSLEMNLKSARTSYLTGEVYVKIGEFNNAFQCFTNAEKIYNTLSADNDDQSTIKQHYSALYINMGLLFYALDSLDKAKHYFEVALQYASELEDNMRMAASWSNIGMTNEKKGNFRQAKQQYTHALEIARSIGHKKYEAAMLSNIAVVYEDLSKLDTALVFYLKARKIIVEIGDKFGLSLVNRNIARVQNYVGNHHKAINYLIEADRNANEIKSKTEIYQNYKEFSRTYELLGNKDRALSYYKKFTQLKDSVIGEDQNKLLADIQVKYEAEKKENENLALKKENGIQQLKISRKNIFIYSLSAGVVIIFFLLILNFIQFRRRLMSYKLLAEKNLEIVHFEKAIKKKPKVDSGNEQTTELVQKLIDYMENEKPYLLSDVNFTDICKHMNTNRSYLSGAINNHYRINFTQLINRYRINDARFLLSDIKYDHISVEGIGQMVGFVSRSVFYRNFKNLTGITPSFFRNSINN